MPDNRKRPPLGPFSPASLKGLRAATGWTQEECSAAIHSTRRTLQDWEAGIAPMHPGLWELINIKAARRLRELSRV